MRAVVPVSRSVTPPLSRAGEQPRTCRTYLLQHWLGWTLAVFGLMVVPAALAWEAERLLQLAGRHGGQTAVLAQALTEVIHQMTRQDDETRLHSINQFFNRRLLFREDIETWGQIDYWASPLEFLEKGQGDCEDYAIGKYFSLIASGVPPTRLRLVYVKAIFGGQASVQQAHMVLAYYPSSGADPLILDNLIGDIRPASKRPDLIPVFSFNSEGLWQGTQGPGAGDAVARLSRWREVLVKARDQGFL
ncbi:transglutaminase-like cysteine peptidase [Sphaerotilus sp.]|uniref:transglutaminase-like cysteine peptidase n=1 Tax=Sphaerotilus sp. TaxID=2093942 RepID=UPI00286E92C5|nr:transglutaminase-like cysteine peptidase [Sphaerotilus sp.]